MTLSGKRVLITRQQNKAIRLAELLQAYGAAPLILSTIKIAPARDSGPLDRALENLQYYDWLIFTSANAVDAVWDRPGLKNSVPLPQSLRVAAIGPITASSLQARGVEPQYIPETHIAEAILPGLGELRGCRVLLPMADIATKSLPEAIQNAGGVPEVVTAYHTLPAQPAPEAMSLLEDGLDVVTFTSGSTVRNFISVVEGFGMDPHQLPGSPLFACIGPKTARVATEIGLQVDIVPEQYTIEGLVQALKTYFSDPKLRSERR